MKDALPLVAGHPTASIMAPILMLLSPRAKAWVKIVRHGYWIAIKNVYVTIKIAHFFKKPLQLSQMVTYYL